MSFPDCPTCGARATQWERGRARCIHCGLPILYDLDSGYWIHAGFGQVDGRNGLYCSPEMWDDPSIRKHAVPAPLYE